MVSKSTFPCGEREQFCKRDTAITSKDRHKHITVRANKEKTVVKNEFGAR